MYEHEIEELDAILTRLMAVLLRREKLDSADLVDLVDACDHIGAAIESLLRED